MIPTIALKFFDKDGRQQMTKDTPKRKGLKDLGFYPTGVAPTLPNPLCQVWSRAQTDRMTENALVSTVILKLEFEQL